MNVFWMCVQRLRCFVVGCNNEYSSCHLLPTSEPLKAQRINVTFVFGWNAPIPICLNVSMFAQIIGDAASSTEGVSIRVFNESLQIAFPNNSTALHPMEERGGVGIAH